LILRTPMEILYTLTYMNECCLSIEGFFCLEAMRNEEVFLPLVVELVGVVVRY
jgi:hypothetical protein